MPIVPDRDFNSPLAPKRLRHVISLMGLNPDSRILDVGCGNGAMLEMALETSGARVGVGVDPLSYEIDEARTRLKPFGKNAVLHNARIQEIELEPGTFDVVMCVGSTHAFGEGALEYRGALTELTALVRPEGRLLVGVGHWSQEPEVDYLMATGIDRSEMQTYDENLAVAESLGLHTEYAEPSTLAEWDQFENTTWRAAQLNLTENPEDAKAQSDAAHWQDWNTSYQRWGRGTFGFGLFLFRTPDRP